MDASLNQESVRPFVLLDEHLRRLGFRAPEILARDLERGFLLLEDFGDDTFASLIEKGAAPEPLYTVAIDALIALHRKADAVPSDLRRYHPEKMLEDIELFLEWRATDLPDAARNEFRKVWSDVLPIAHQVPASLLLRDYHVANLMMPPGSTGLDRAGLLDFQDAYGGPITYDLVSLLEDARRDLPAGLEEAMLARYFEQFPALDRAAFEASRAVVAAQRHTRVLAIFERLSRRDAKDDYKRLHSPRVERRLWRALQHPVLSGVRQWMTRYVGTH
jgi:aminoglycoside/choline kinase family phosphotransferase